MAMNKRGFLCDGCGKTHWCTTVDEKMPTGWLSSYDGYWRLSGNRWDAGPWVGGVTACSADCVNAAKENQKKHAQDAVDRYKARIDAAVLERT